MVRWWYDGLFNHAPNNVYNFKIELYIYIGHIYIYINLQYLDGCVYSHVPLQETQEILAAMKTQRKANFTSVPVKTEPGAPATVSTWMLFVLWVFFDSVLTPQK